MYELSRVRLYSVGPPGARYEDVLIDLSGAGAPVQHHQPLLFGHAAPLFRPAPASVLFLENGGGKSVLIKLIFSVVLPGRRQVVGTTNTRVLEKFVGARDVAHVVLEWIHSETGRLLLTGKVSEWRDRRVSADVDNLLDLWYCLRPGRATTLDTLPFAEDGQNLSAAEFRSRLVAADTADPTLDLYWTRTHGQWTERLDFVGLDTELFRYQRAMNAGEGEAADAFTFGSDEAFVEFLLRAVLPEEGPNEVADVLTTYAETLSRRGALTLEHDFVGSVLALLGSLTDKQRAAVTARDGANSVVDSLRRLAAEVASRAAREKKLLDQRVAHIAEIETAEKVAAAAHAEQTDVCTELARRVAQLHLDAARTAEKAAATAAAAAKLTAQAWRATTAALKHLNTAATARRLENLVAAEEDAARPALEERNAAARALVRALMAVVQEAEQEAGRQRGLATASAERAAGVQRQHTEAIRAAAQAAVLASQLDARIAEVHEELVGAARDGLLAPDTSAINAATALSARVDADAAALALQEQRLRELGEEYLRTQSDLDEARKALSLAHQRHGEASTALRRATERTTVLAAEPRLVELLDTDSLVLDSDAPTLLSLLADAQARTDQARTHLRVAEAADEHAWLALDSGGLLPPAADVTETHETLQKAGITCWTGWEYLTEIPDLPTRWNLVRRLPHLAGGVLLNDPADLDRVSQLVAKAGLRPTGIVAVAATSALGAASSEPANLSAADEFVVPPHPALFDPEAARAEHAVIQARHAERLAALAELDRSLAADRALSTRLTAWHADYPPGTLAALAQDAADSKQALHATTEVENEFATRVNALAQARAELQDLLSGMRAALRGLEADARRLAALAERERKIAPWSREADGAWQVEAAETEHTLRIEERCADLRVTAAEHQRVADQHEATAARARADQADIRGGAQARETDPVPEAAVPVLRARLHDAERAYAQVEMGADLRAELEQALAAESAAKGALDEFDGEILARAAELLASAAGSDHASRSAARDYAERELQRAEHRLASAVGEAAARKTTLDGLPRPNGRPVLPATPRDVAHGEQLLKAITIEAADAAARHRDLVRQRSEADEALETLRRTAEAFGLLAATTRTHAAARDGQAAEPYEGNADSADEQYIHLRGACEAAEAAARAAEDALRSAADEVAQCAADSRFEALNSPVRTQILAVQRNALPEHAVDWTQALRPRLRTLADELGQIDRHRDAIVMRLQALVEDALRTLRMAQRLSRLPRGLDDWSDKEFLRIVFTSLEGTVLANRVGEVVDEAAASPGRDGHRVKRDGLSLLLRGVMAAVPKGFRVDMLKPDAVLSDERERVSEIRDVFSGGQQLTAAIIVYCTMAGLRANDRGRARHRHSGVLFLDNPIGRASAGYLLDIQRGVAAALGVQLIYTTGLFDADALSGFPMIVRLRNDADLRAGRKYLSVEHTVRPHLAALSPPDGTGVLSSTRIFLRERQRHDQPESPRR